MNTTRLYEFLVLSKALNYSKAAKALYLSQSVLSRHIQELEKELGTPLLVRNTHGAVLTEAGQVLKANIPKLLDRWDSAITQLHSPLLKADGRIKIGLSLEYSYASHIQNFMQHFQREYPAIELQYYVYSANTPSHEALKHDIFITPCAFHSMPESSIRRLVRHHGIQALLPPDHALTGKSAVYLLQLKEETIIVPYAEESFGPYAQNYLLAEKATKGLLSCIKTDTLSTALFMTCMGKGICLAPRYAHRLSPSRMHGLTIRDQNCHFDEYIYCNSPENPAAQLFFQKFQDMFFGSFT